MLKKTYFLNNEQVEAPQNIGELQIDVNFDKGSSVSTVTLQDFRQVLRNAQIIESWNNSGFIYEGIPFTINLTENNNSVDLDFYLDGVNGAIYSCYDSTLQAVETGKIDWLNNNADGFTFEYLFETRNSLFVDKIHKVPYVINAIPDNRDIFLSILGIAVVTIEIKGIVESIKQKTSALVDPFSSISNAIQAILLVIYIISLLVTLVTLVIDLITLIIQPVKYHSGMYVKDLIEIGCEHLDLTFESSIFEDKDWKDLFIIPEKLGLPDNFDDNRLKGWIRPQDAPKGYYNGTFGELVRQMLIMFNAKIILDEGVLRIERDDYYPTAPTYTLPPVEQDFFTTNADELNSTYIIKFQTDLNDKNTFTEYDGTITQINTSPRVVNNPKNLIRQGFTDQSINFSRATRKEDLTKPEAVVKGLLVGLGAVMNALIFVANGVVKVYNTVARAIKKLKKVLGLVGIKINLNLPEAKPIPKTDFGEIIDNRIGMVMLENDYINTPKIMILRKGSEDKNNKIDPNNKNIVSSERLWKDFHSVNGFADVQTGDFQHLPNQWIRKTLENVPFCFEDYLEIRKNSSIFDNEGRESRVESLQWNVERQTATINYRFRQKFTDNLREQIITPNGQ